MSFGASIRDGKLILDNPGRWAGALMRYDGKRVTVDVSAEKRGATKAQRGLYWGYLIPALCEWTGYAEKEMHDALRTMFLSCERTLPNGTVIDSVRSTERLTTAEKSDYHEKCYAWAAQQGCYVPDHDSEEAHR